VAVINRDLQVKAWNRRAEDLWGLRTEEAAGQHFLNLDIGLPTEQLRPMIRSALADSGQPLEANVSAVNRRGRSITVRVVCTPLSGSGRDIDGAVVIMEHAEDQLAV
jgi:two-component system CheB/CheR fusion protein